MSDDSDRTASLMSPAKLAQLRARPAPATPSAWLNQMASDAGSVHVHRLLALGKQIEAQARERNYTDLCSALQRVNNAADSLDFALLQPRGWLARATGKGREAVADFLAQYEQVGEAIDNVVAHVQILHKKQPAQTIATDRSLMEFEVELRAIEKVIDQGTRWLQDMRNQLKSRETDATDTGAQQKIAQDAQRCDVLVGRLKQLRVAATVAAQTHQQLKTVAVERNAAMQLLRQILDTETRAWRAALKALAADAENVDPASLHEPRQAHEQLQARMQEVQRELVQLQSREGAVAEEVALLAEPLQAVS